MMRVKSVKVVSNPESMASIAVNLVKHSSDSHIATLQEEIAQLKKSLSKAGELIEEIKTENKLQKVQLRKFGQEIDIWFKNNNKKAEEVDAEFNEEEFNNNKKGESDHE